MQRWSVYGPFTAPAVRKVKPWEVYGVFAVFRVMRNDKFVLGIVTAPAMRTVKALMTKWRINWNSIWQCCVIAPAVIMWNSTNRERVIFFLYKNEKKKQGSVCMGRATAPAVQRWHLEKYWVIRCFVYEQWNRLSNGVQHCPHHENSENDYSHGLFASHFNDCPCRLSWGYDSKRPSRCLRREIVKRWELEGVISRGIYRSVYVWFGGVFKFVWLTTVYVLFIQ